MRIYPVFGLHGLHQAATLQTSTSKNEEHPTRAVCLTLHVKISAPAFCAPKHCISD